MIELDNPAAGTRPYESTTIDHAITFKALSTMQDNGNAVLVLGAPMEQKMGSEERDVKAAYNEGQTRSFFHTLYANYNVTQHFTVAGDLYKKQGTTFPIDVVVIEGRGKSDLELPAVKTPPVYRTWDELRQVMEQSVNRQVDLQQDIEPTPSTLARQILPVDQQSGATERNVSKSVETPEMLEGVRGEELPPQLDKTRVEKLLERVTEIEIFAEALDNVMQAEVSSTTNHEQLQSFEAVVEAVPETETSTFAETMNYYIVSPRETGTMIGPFETQLDGEGFLESLSNKLIVPELAEALQSYTWAEIADVELRTPGAGNTEVISPEPIIELIKAYEQPLVEQAGTITLDFLSKGNISFKTLIESPYFAETVVVPELPDNNQLLISKMGESLTFNQILADGISEDLIHLKFEIELDSLRLVSTQIKSSSSFEPESAIGCLQDWADGGFVEALAHMMVPEVSGTTNLGHPGTYDVQLLLHEAVVEAVPEVETSTSAESELPSSAETLNDLRNWYKQARAIGSSENVLERIVAIGTAFKEVGQPISESASKRMTQDKATWEKLVHSVADNTRLLVSGLGTSMEAGTAFESQKYALYIQNGFLYVLSGEQDRGVAPTQEDKQVLPDELLKNRNIILKVTHGEIDHRATCITKTDHERFDRFVAKVLASVNDPVRVGSSREVER